jgi:predicted lipoprotein with Yx(FWY)xxD motif
MKLWVRQILSVALAVGAAAVVLAACGDGADDGNATAADLGLVSVENVDGTNVLADADGRTLYTADVERGKIRCSGACISFWEPVEASANEAESASAELGLDLGVVDRPFDGGRQLTFNGLPLYSFTEEGPGRLEGDGFEDDFKGTHFEWAAATTGDESRSAGSEPSDVSPY